KQVPPSEAASPVQCLSSPPLAPFSGSSSIVPRFFPSPLAPFTRSSSTVTAAPSPISISGRAPVTTSPIAVSPRVAADVTSPAPYSARPIRIAAPSVPFSQTVPPGPPFGPP
uniref:PCOTH protein n=1 Tax=Steinernema glaseri TaxID=37863 RepID=A0A1I7YXG9_9BILA